MSFTFPIHCLFECVSTLASGSPYAPSSCSYAYRHRELETRAFPRHFRSRPCRLAELSW
jgi:hypothetical protein